jgi:hypothetical protein
VIVFSANSLRPPGPRAYALDSSASPRPPLPSSRGRHDYSNARPDRVEQRAAIKSDARTHVGRRLRSRAYWRPGMTMMDAKAPPFARPRVTRGAGSGCGPRCPPRVRFSGARNRWGAPAVRPTFACRVRWCSAE